MNTTMMSEQKTIFSGCGHELERVIQDMACPVCMKIEIEHLQAKVEQLEAVAEAAEGVVECSGQTLLGCAQDSDYPNCPEAEKRAHEYGANKAFEQCAAMVAPALAKLQEQQAKESRNE